MDTILVNTIVISILFGIILGVAFGVIKRFLDYN